jgi:hypothetical protein
MNSTSDKKPNTVTDLIIILDESRSMESMGDEPVQSVNSIFNEQKNKQEIDDGSTATLVTFNDISTCIINGKKFSELKEIDISSYTPHGGTALNDTICNTIKHKIDSDKPDNVVLVIITDGEENSSKAYSQSDVKRMIKLVEDNHFWKVIFIGANIDVFECGDEMNIKLYRCAQFDQKTTGSLLSLCRTTSLIIEDYRRSRNKDLTMPCMDLSFTEKMFSKQLGNDLHTNKWPLVLERQRAL